MDRQVSIPSLRYEGAPDSCISLMAYPIAGKPLCLHYLEAVASLTASDLRISIGDHWFENVPALVADMERFGRVDFDPTARDTPIDYPRRVGGPIPVAGVWNVLDVAAEILSTMRPFIAPTAVIERDVEISGNVVVDEGVKVLSGARLKGDVYVGRNGMIGNGALVRGSTSIGKNSLVGFNAEIKNSLLMDDVTVGPTSAVPDCIIEDRVFLGGLVRISNTNLRFAPVRVRSADAFVDSGRKFLGAFIGADTVVAGGVRIAPGRIVGPGSDLGPGLIISREVASGSVLRLKQEIISVVSPESVEGARE
jgi:carbonic anhydrase/acetyltransferase-like protein (isoleucine patch superfamily)